MTVFLSVTFRPAIQSPSLSTTTLGFKLPQASESETVFHLLWIHLGTLLKNEGRAFRMLHYCGGCGCGATCWFFPRYFVLCHIIVVLNCYFTYVMIIMEKWRIHVQRQLYKSFTIVGLWLGNSADSVFEWELFVCIVRLCMVTRIDIQCAIYCFRMGISVANVNF